MAKKRTKFARPIKDSYAIVVDGYTEAWYFQMMKRNEPDLQVNIEPKIPQKKKLSDQYEKICELAEDYTKVFWVIDLDVVIAEKKIKKLISYLKKLKNHKNIITIFNNPCLEFWFLLHFQQITKYFPKCSNVEKKLKNHLDGYEKTKKYFTRHNNDIYLKLKPELPVALKNSHNTQRGSLGHDQMERGICEMNLFSYY